ncbi:23S rRNA (uracil(1939)-C(5))-methyltransferase RlmD [Alteromonas sp. A081]|uniref:23S rRNA (uracil(1939)-C(5))-methyltransferase RlmD n=1 Tax=Alteromonas sp. A081 TaxID=3410269 RepID=UPI003B97EDB1
MSNPNKPAKGKKQNGLFNTTTLKRKTSANAQVANLRFSDKTQASKTKVSKAKATSSAASNPAASGNNSSLNSSPSQKHTQLLIESLDWMGQGIARTTPVHFVEGALPGETCDISVLQAKKNVVNAKATAITHPSSMRATPFCPVFDQCGGCQLQHIDAQYALTERDNALKSMMVRQLAMEDGVWQAPLSGAKPAYRRKARLAVDARRMDKLKLGFRSQASNEIVDITSCPVLTDELSRLITPLRAVLSSCESTKWIGHIGLLAGDNVCQVTIKHVKAISHELYNELIVFAKQERINVVLENKKGRCNILHRQATLTMSSFDEFTLSPAPNDFVQVNKYVNNQMIEQALNWLAPKPQERIADWFSGLGNFTLSIAKRVAVVQAVEGVAEMVQRARDNAQQQGVHNIEWLHLDLSNNKNVSDALNGGFDKVLLDPSREGALIVCQALVNAKPSTIVYVSCNPSTFTRDANVLIQGGYLMKKAGAVEMFPYTHHMEMMALFTR